MSGFNLVERLREASDRCETHEAWDLMEVCTEAADLPEEALKHLTAAGAFVRTVELRASHFGDTAIEAEAQAWIAHRDAILTKSQGEKIDG